MTKRIVKKRKERAHSKFNIGPNSHPRKVQRWIRRGGGANIPEKPHQHAGNKQNEIAPGITVNRNGVPSGGADAL